jgi:hypothetical protein
MARIGVNRNRLSGAGARTRGALRKVFGYAVAQAALGILIDVVLLVFAIYSQSAQFALGMFALGCVLAFAFLLIWGWRSVGGGMILGVVLWFVLGIVWYAYFCSGCGE